MTTGSLPAASTVSRALRRDFEIITSPYGYSVHRGLKNITAPSVHVHVGNSFTDMRKARQLAEAMREHGWEVELADGSTIIYITKVPTAAERRAQEQA